MYFVYALYNSLNKRLYVGQTNDLETRVRLHNTHAFSSSYTARLPGKWLLFYSEEYQTRKAALQREKQLKSYRGREFLKSLIPR